MNVFNVLFEGNKRYNSANLKLLSLYPNIIKEMGDDVSRIIRATVRLRHVLASATAIARSSQRHFNETVVRVMNECAQVSLILILSI